MAENSDCFQLFYDIGKFSLSYIIKSASRGDAHSRERQMSAKADCAAADKILLTKLTCLPAQAPLRIKATDCSALRAPAILPVFAIRTTVLLAHTG